MGLTLENSVLNWAEKLKNDGDKAIVVVFTTMVIIFIIIIVIVSLKEIRLYLVDHLDDEISSDPLSVVIIDYKEEHVLFRSRRRATEGIFRVNLKPDQKVNLCLQNGLVTAGRGRKSPTARSHDGLERNIGFGYSVDIKDEKQEVHSQNDKNTQAAKDLRRQLGNLINHHQYMRMREMKHREVVEMTFTQLMRWCVLEAFFVITIAAGQIMYFRNFLERRRYM